MADPIIGAFLYTGVIAVVAIVGGVASRSLPRTSLVRALAVPFGLAGAVWVIVAAAVITVRVIQIAGM